MSTILKVPENHLLTVVGMLHLLALPGSPDFGGSVKKIRDTVLRDADLLARGGVHALMLENFGDIPFYKHNLPAYVVAEMTAIACMVKERFDLPLGINCLRNDGISALSVASAAGADYIRVNVLTGARVTDQGVIEGNAAELMRLRTQLNAKHIAVLADVDVKHSVPLGPSILENDVDDTIERGKADGLIVSGAGTGKATDVEKAKRIRSAAPHAPLFVGSGVTLQSVKTFIPHVTGVIVGTYFKVEGNVANAVDIKRVKGLMNAVKK